MTVEDGIQQSVTRYCASGNSSAFSIDASLKFAPDFPAFDGHFPGNPILPGIVQLACVRILAARFLGKRLLSKTLSNIKFRDMVRPDQPVNICLYGEEKDNGWKVRFEINSSDTAIASGDMKLVIQKGKKA